MVGLIDRARTSHSVKSAQTRDITSAESLQVDI